MHLCSESNRPRVSLATAYANTNANLKTYNTIMMYYVISTNILYL